MYYHNKYMGHSDLHSSSRGHIVQGEYRDGKSTKKLSGTHRSGTDCHVSVKESNLMGVLAMSLSNDAALSAEPSGILALLQTRKAPAGGALEMRGS
jgi:hypothetical protein